MASYLLDWLGLLLRWAHVLAAMAWIGAAFHFIWLDSQPAPAGSAGAFIHYGAVIGTIMAGNVAHVIVPGQRRMQQALSEGRAPDAMDSAACRQRSVHNTYLTLPVLFTMISSHYALVFGAPWNWLALAALTLAGGLIRAWFVLRHRGAAPAWPLLTGIGVLLALLLLLLPDSY